MSQQKEQNGIDFGRSTKSKNSKLASYLFCFVGEKVYVPLGIRGNKDKNVGACAAVKDKILVVAWLCGVC